MYASVRAARLLCERPVGASEGYSVDKEEAEG